MALGVVRADVVAFLVVVLRSEVLLVFGGDHSTLGSLLDREADSSALEVQVDDLDPQLLARGHHLLGEVDVVGRHLGDVHQALDPISYLYKRTEWHQLGDPPVDQLSHLVTLRELLPWVLLCRLQRKADPFPGHVHVKDLDFDLIAYRDYRSGMVDVFPGEFRHVDQPVHPT